ncbi:hypothetical protein ARMSODRAFT_1012890 [Armillaria solidipes]|uniref:Uncharacterized protein n=1 Tax=Armillaria solidipes TaxID=1076256 RepID=A0A2H3CAR6_9AGAR|nr:hypothetical protein ARMSODRAFT_1012890 [Armillaria solidipes]
MARLASLLQPQWLNTSSISPIHLEETSPSSVWVGELTSPRDCASNIDSHQQDRRQLLPESQQQSLPNVHERVASIRRLRWMLEETKKVNTLVKQDISILEAALRELIESVSPPPEFEPQYSTVFPSIWTLKPDEILHGNSLTLPSPPPLVRHETRHALPSSSPGWPRLNIPLHSQSPAVSSPVPASQVRADSEDMLYQTQPPPPATIPTESVMFQENTGMCSPQAQDLSSQTLAPRTPPPATIPTESVTFQDNNTGVHSPQRHEAQDLLSPRTVKYTIPPRRQDPQVKSTQQSAEPSSRAQDERQQERRPDASQTRQISSAPPVQTTEPRMTTALLLERPELKYLKFPENCHGLENPRLGDPASLWCRYHAFYVRRIPLPRGIRRTAYGLPSYSDVVGWRAFVCLRPPAGLRMEDSTTSPYVLFTEALMTLFSRAGVYPTICKRLRLKLNENGVLSSYKGPFIVNNHESMVEEVAKHLNNCGVTFQFAGQYILPFIMELKRQRG